MEQVKVQDTAMFKTRDYSSFKILNYNRGIDEKRIQGLMQSIKENGFLMPILVSNNMEVADGQHRLEAAKRMNAEVTYIRYNIEDELLPVLISKLNSLSKNWGNIDYYTMWSQRGKEPYIWLGSLMEKYNMNFDEVILLSNIMRGASKSFDKFKDGTIEFTDNQRERTEFACIKFNEVVNFSPAFKEFNRTFRRALLEVIRHPEYDQARMLRKLKNDGGRILNCMNRIDFLFQIEALYNMGEKNQIEFIKTKGHTISKAAKKKQKIKN